MKTYGCDSPFSPSLRSQFRRLPSVLFWQKACALAVLGLVLAFTGSAFAQSSLSADGTSLPSQSNNIPSPFFKQEFALQWLESKAMPQELESREFPKGPLQFRIHQLLEEITRTHPDQAQMVRVVSDGAGAALIYPIYPNTLPQVFSSVVMLRLYQLFDLSPVGPKLNLVTPAEVGTLLRQTPRPSRWELWQLNTPLRPTEINRALPMPGQLETTKRDQHSVVNNVARFSSSSVRPMPRSQVIAQGSGWVLLATPESPPPLSEMTGPDQQVTPCRYVHPSSQVGRLDNGWISRAQIQLGR